MTKQLMPLPSPSPSPTPTQLVEQHSVALDAILAAQNGKYRNQPQLETYATALAEISGGMKRTCWMWIIWPTVRGVRMHRMEWFMLSDFEEARAYLRHETLGPRLVEITSAAAKHLLVRHHTVDPIQQLFDGKIDIVKFHEACTVFAAAAVANGDEASAEVFAGIMPIYGGLNEASVRFLENANHGDYVKRVDELWKERIPTTTIFSRTKRKIFGK